MFEDYKSIPIGSLLLRDRPEEQRYMQRLAQLPNGLIDVLMSPTTAAYLRGLLKINGIPLEQAPIVAFAVLQICFGEKTLAQLSSMLSTELRLPHDKAQAVASEIERELFSPVLLELNQYLAQKRQAAKSPFRTEVAPFASPLSAPPQPSAPAREVKNVLDLKNQKPQPPKPPPTVK